MYSISAFQTHLIQEPQGLPPDLDDYIGHSRLLRKYSLDLATDSQPLAQSELYKLHRRAPRRHLSEIEHTGRVLFDRKLRVRMHIAHELIF